MNSDNYLAATQPVSSVPLSQAIQNPAAVVPNSKGANPTFPAADPSRLSNPRMKIVTYSPTLIPGAK